MPPRIVSGPRASIATTRNVLRAMRTSSADCARGVTSSFTIDGASTSSLHGRARPMQTGAAPRAAAGLPRENAVARDPHGPCAEVLTGERADGAVCRFGRVDRRQAGTHEVRRHEPAGLELPVAAQ